MPVDVEDPWRWFVTAPFLFARSASATQFAALDGRRHLRDAAGAPLRTRCRSWPCSCSSGAAGAALVAVTLEVPPLLDKTGAIYPVMARERRGAGVALRLARGRSPRGAERGGARATT